MSTDQSDNLHEFFTWPSSQHRLFSSKPATGQATAKPSTTDRGGFFAYMHKHQWNRRYREGYFWAGENLGRDLADSEALRKGDNTRELTGVYLPMLYCYRHYLEVSLKHLISVVAPLSDETLKPDLEKEHALMPLWNEAKRHMLSAFGPPDDGDETDNHVERLISEFHQYDPRSQTFRYRHDAAGRPHEEKLPSGDLQQLMEAMRALRSYFGGCEDLAAEAAEHQA